jgi:sterol desaturase/sphingolipid hydroxylase (fatty acid hydroxylase superfamily)
MQLNEPIRLGGLIAACVLLSSLEAVVPLFSYRPGRLRRALPNLALAAGVLLTNLAFTSMTAALSAWVVSNQIGLLSGLRSHRGLQLGLGIAGLDLFAYFAHVLLHKIPLGWRFHRVHHSEPEVDVTTALRQHPGETLWRLFWQMLGVAVFGLPFWIMPVYLGLSSMNALLEHANLRVDDRLDRLLRSLIVTPNMHKIHHSRHVSETDSNYSNIFSVWDRLCGTYVRRILDPTLRYGLDGYDDGQKQTLAALISEPFRNSA